MKKIFNTKALIIIIGGILLLFGLIIYSLKNEKELSNDIVSLETTSKTTLINKEKKYIDIKGSVKNPGVYEFNDNDRVIDAINLAGGLKKDANTSNINLSKKLESEMVIYVYNNNEIKNSKNNFTCETTCSTEVIEVNNCIEKTTVENKSTLVNINTATIEELQTIDGIGETKAKSIINYRNDIGKFNSIEDIKNVSGIGDSLFNKIKDKITT